MTQQIENIRREWEQAIAELRMQGVNLLDPNERDPLRKLQASHESITGFVFDVAAGFTFDDDGKMIGRVIRLCVHTDHGDLFRIPIDERPDDTLGSQLPH